MNSIIIVFCVALATASAHPSLWLGGAATLVGPGNPGAILKGPGAKASVLGPDGSAIGAIADAGTVIAAPQRGGAVSAAVSPGLIGLTAPAIGLGGGVGWGRAGLIAPGLATLKGW